MVEHPVHPAQPIELLLPGVVGTDYWRQLAQGRTQQQVKTLEEPAQLPTDQVALIHRRQQVDSRQRFTIAMQRQCGRFQPVTVERAASLGTQGIKPGRCIAGPETRIHLDESVPRHADIQVHQFALVTKMFQGLDHPLQSLNHQRIAALTIERMQLHGNSQGTRHLLHCTQVTAFGRCHLERIARFRPGHAIEQQGAVAYRTAEHTLHRQAVPGFVQERPHGNQPAAGLQAKQTAGRSRHPDRTATIGGMGNGHHTAGNCCCRTTAGTTGAAVQVPGVAGRAAQARFGGGADGQFRRGGAPQGDQPGPAKTLHQERIGRTAGTLCQAAAELVGAALHADRQVLDQKRHAVQRPFSAGG
ncbi:hypothetical protein D3C79_665320 [compost metagenome]